MKRAVHRARVSLALSAAAAVVAVAVGVLGGCESNSDRGDGSAVRKDERPAPGFAEAVKGYNARLEHIQRLRARVVVRLKYRDEGGEWQDEQAEGTLQLVLPDRVAMSLGKAGRTVFWFGCDVERYWWFDMQDRPTASVGVRTPDGARAREKLGVNVAPWDLVRLLGVMRLDAAGGGVTEWSKDRALVGVTTAIRVGNGSGAVVGYQRIWADPKDWFPSRIELWDADRRRVVVAELEGDERAEIMDRPVLGHRPRMPARVSVLPEGSEAQIRLSLSDVSDQRISDRAFDLDALMRNFSVEPADVRDLDAVGAASTVGAER